MITVCTFWTFWASVSSHLTGNKLAVYTIKASNALSADATNSGFLMGDLFWNTPEITLPLTVCSFTVPSSILEIVGVNGDGSRTAAPNLRTSQGGRSSWMGVRFQSGCLSVYLFVCCRLQHNNNNNNNNTSSPFPADECEWIFHERSWTEELWGGCGATWKTSVR